MIISHEEEKVVKTEVVDKVVCNCCGQEIEKLYGGKMISDYVHIDKEFNHLSKKDNEIHSMDICEDCYDKIISTFKIKPFITEKDVIAKWN